MLKMINVMDAAYRVVSLPEPYVMQKWKNMQIKK